jgi:hypothetical protein
VGIAELLRWQWQGYERYHGSRTNLLIHIVVVPVFLLGNIGLVIALVQRSLLLANCAVLGPGMAKLAGEKAPCEARVAAQNRQDGSPSTMVECLCCRSVVHPPSLRLPYGC